jgi:hypothetical protein
MADARLMTYAELAQALDISDKSVRALVRRKRWQRKPGNDGLARVVVPTEHLEAAGGPDGSPHGGPDEGPGGSPHDEGVIATLQRHIERLEREIVARDAERGRLQGDIDALRRDLVEERARAALLQAEAAMLPTLRLTMESLKSALECERARLSEVRSERDRLTARRSWWPFRRAS